jgi:hypothetical protein
MSRLWKKIERVGTENFPVFLEDDDLCYYARDYIAEGGYAASEANNLISNFKKPVSKKGRPEWRYKLDAISQFAREVAPPLRSDMLVTCIPSSKSKSDPDYDSRLEDVLAEVIRLRPGIIVDYPISIDTSVLPAHCGGSRNPSVIYSYLKWNGLREKRHRLALIDDVITSGAHFKACQRLIRENEPGIQILGFFWTRTAWI